MESYLKLITKVLERGEIRSNRTSTKTVGIFGAEFEHDCRVGFPLLTTKQMNFKPVVAELVGFIRGVTSAAAFRQIGTKIWDANANTTLSWVNNPHRKGLDDLGPIYGAQWRNWTSRHTVPEAKDFPGSPEQSYLAQPSTVLKSPGKNNGMWEFELRHDQLQGLINSLRNDPFGRRHIVSAWNVGDLHKMALPPCHVMFQCYVSNDGYLDLKMYQRSADLFLGVPFNIASYAALLHVIAKLTGYRERMLYISFGDLHIYTNHVDQCLEQSSREPKRLPELTLAPMKYLEDVNVNSFHLHGYNDPHPPLKGVMAE